MASHGLLLIRPPGVIGVKQYQQLVQEYIDIYIIYIYIYICIIIHESTDKKASLAKVLVVLSSSMLKLNWFLLPLEGTLYWIIWHIKHTSDI